MAMVKSANKKIAIIGGGHMGQALAQGIINNNSSADSQLIVANPTIPKIIHLKKLGIEITYDNKHAVQNADWIFLAVKPSVVKTVLSEIKHLSSHKLIISLATGITVYDLKKEINNLDTGIARIMPNIPVVYNQGVIGLFSKNVESTEIKKLKAFLSHLGLVFELEDEDDLDVFTLLSGCGPAIVSYCIEVFKNYGIEHGLSDRMAQKVAIQTYIGSLVYLDKSKTSPSQLIMSVATKGGITEAILTSMKKHKFKSYFFNSLDAGLEKLKRIKL